MFQFLMFILLIVFASRSWADQCRVLTDKKQADLAAAIINSHPDFQYFCAPCGDKTSQFVHSTLAKVESFGSHPAQYQINVNSATGIKNIDLAYVYAKTGAAPQKYINLAFLVKCPVKNVPYSITGDGRKDIRFPSAMSRIIDIGGYYSIETTQPKGKFKNIETLAIDFGGGTNATALHFTGQVVLKNGHRLPISTIHLVGKHINFETIEENGLRYKFKGIFSAMGDFKSRDDQGRAVRLSGHLIEVKSGKIKEAADVQLSYFAGD
jgi:hypothetical protein